MAISKKTLDLINLALQDRVLTFKERQVIAENATKEALSRLDALTDKIWQNRDIRTRSVVIAFSIAVTVLIFVNRQKILWKTFCSFHFFGNFAPN